MKPIDHQTDEEDPRDRFADIVAAAARGEPIPPADADFRRRYQEAHPDAAGEADLWAAVGSLGGPRAEEGGVSDADLTARVLERARSPHPSLRRPARPAARRRALAFAFAAAALAAGLLAAFAGEIRARLFLPISADPSAAYPSPAPPSALPDPLMGDAPEPPAPVLPPTLEAPPAVPAPREPAAARSSSAPAIPSADELLRRAQAQLGAGHAPEAVESYRELCARYPASVEARAALVSLGRLALDRGDVEEALGHFDRYLSSPGPLGEEARYWRIEALRRLGRGAAEAAAIEEFLRRHPDSVHVERLRARAAALGGG